MEINLIDFIMLVLNGETWKQVSQQWYWVHFIALLVGPFYIIRILRKRGTGTMHSLGAFFVGFFLLFLLANTMEAHDKAYRAYEVRGTADKLHILYAYLYVAFGLGTFYGFFRKSNVSANLSQQRRLFFQRQADQRQEKARLKAEAERHQQQEIDQARAREDQETRLNLQLAIEREKTKQAEIAAQVREKELEQQRPAKTKALNDILDKLDDL